MGFMDWLRGRQEDYETEVPLSPAQLPSLPPARVGPSASPSYSIENAIELMRALPFDENPELVLRVLRKTLRSIGVSVEEIVESAEARELALATDAAEQRAAISQFEQQIAALRATIERIEGELQETRSVRERLEQAMENETKIATLPVEVERLKAEAAAVRSGSASPWAADAKPDAVANHAASTPKPSSPPVPKSGAPPLPKRALAPKPQSSAPSKSTRPDPPAVREEAASLPIPPVADGGAEQAENRRGPPPDATKD
jgi:uncharacterized small protein (DUF1192 family)